MIFNPVRSGGGKPKQVKVSCRFGHLLAGMQNGVGIGVWERSPGGTSLDFPIMLDANSICIVSESGQAPSGFVGMTQKHGPFGSSSKRCVICVVDDA
jgi:hypothetical protein